MADESIRVDTQLPIRIDTSTVRIDFDPVQSATGERKPLFVSPTATRPGSYWKRRQVLT